MYLIKITIDKAAIVAGAFLLKHHYLTLLNMAFMAVRRI